MLDTTEILGFISTSQTAAVAVGMAVTILVYAIASTKWLRRAK